MTDILYVHVPTSLRVPSGSYEPQYRIRIYNMPGVLHDYIYYDSIYKRARAPVVDVGYSVYIVTANHMVSCF